MKLILPIAALVFAGSVPLQPANILTANSPKPKQQSAQSAKRDRFLKAHRNEMITAHSAMPSMTVMPKCYLADRYETVNGVGIIKDVNGQTVWDGKMGVTKACKPGAPTPSGVNMAGVAGEAQKSTVDFK